MIQHIWGVFYISLYSNGSVMAHRSFLYSSLLSVTLLAQVLYCPLHAACFSLLGGLGFCEKCKAQCVSVTLLKAILSQGCSCKHNSPPSLSLCPIVFLQITVLHCTSPCGTGTSQPHNVLRYVTSQASGTSGCNFPN